jgi:hypothetical protein
MSETNRIPVEILAKALGAGPDCPELARLVAAAADELPAAEREGVLAHAEGCAACGAELELARGFSRKPSADEADDLEWIVGRLDHRAAAAPAPAVARVLPMRPRRAPVTSARLAIWAAAACAALAVGLSFWAVSDGRAPGLPERPLEDVVRGGSIAWVTPVGTLPALPAELRWDSVAGAASYRVEILDVADRAVLETTTTAPGWTPAAADRARLETFVLYRVRVVAVDAAGGELAASEAAELRLEPAR